MKHLLHLLHILNLLSRRRSGVRAARDNLKAALKLVTVSIFNLPDVETQRALRNVISAIEEFYVEVSDSKVLADLWTSVESLRVDFLEPLSRDGAKAVRAESYLGKSVLQLAENVESLLISQTNARRQHFMLGFLTCKADRRKLATLASDIERAISKFLAEHLNEHGQLLSLSQETLFDVTYDDQKEQQARCLAKLNNVSMATYEHYQRSELASCAEGTRVEVLASIRAWVCNDSVDHPRIFWLHGLAGAGKSTIARSIAEWAKAEGTLGANFFFSKNTPKLRDPTLVFPTLAYQLAHFDESFLLELADVLSTLKTPVDRLDPRSQLTQLILRPWAASRSTSMITRSKKSKVLIVLDGIDECHSESQFEHLLDILVENTKMDSFPGNFLVFIASRSETHSRSVLRMDAGLGCSGVSSYDIEKSVVRQDIETYLRIGMSRIPSGLDVTSPEGWSSGTENLSATLEGWHGGNEIESIAQDCGQLFIYAATALRFIGDYRVRDPAKQLKVLAGRLRSEVTDNPYSTLDKLYLHVLRNAIAGDVDETLVGRVRQVIATTSLLRDPLPMNALAEFLELQKADVHSILYRLNPIVRVPGPHPDPESSSTYFFHQTFVDFVKDAKRCEDGRFQVDCGTEEARMSLRCLKLMTDSLVPNMLHINSGVDAWHIRKNEPGGIDRVFTPLVRYACEYWASHLVKMNPGDFARVALQLRDFVDRLLYWFEATSWLNIFDVAVVSMQSVIDWMIEHDLSRDIRDSLLHGKQFALGNQSFFMQDPLAIYTWGLIFPFSGELPQGRSQLLLGARNIAQEDVMDENGRLEEQTEGNFENSSALIISSKT